MGHLPPASEAAETLKGVLVDMTEVVSCLPDVAPGEAEATARILDRLSEETAEAAALVRRSAR